MRRPAVVIAILATSLAAGAAGFWLGHHGLIASPVVLAKGTAPAPPSHPTGPVIYYQDPDGKPVYSAQPKSTDDGRPFRAVHASEDISFDAKAEAAPEQAALGKRVLYYRNPMGLPDVSKTPKKDSMGMDYIPVYEGEEEDGSTVKISPARVQRAGVKIEKAAYRVVSQPIRAPGTIQLDERRIAIISLRTEAFIDTVENVTTGSEVTKGQPLVRLYSPAIASAAAEYLALLNAGPSSSISQGTRQRLLNLAAPPSLLAEIERTRQVPLTFTWSAPRQGIVLERTVSDGMRVGAGDVLFRIADHSVIWAVVDVAERDLGAISKGLPVMLRVRSFPNRTFEGTVAVVYPSLNAATRTARVRVELPNPDFLLRPDMYADAVIETGQKDPVLSVPEDAVIDSGDRRFIILDKGEGRFEPRTVLTGARGGGYVEVMEGVAEDDTIVTSANFLIDAESNLKAALKGLTEGSAPQ